VLPSVAAYVERLPGGVASYPAAGVKGAVTRRMLDDARLPFPLPAGSIPDEVARFVAEGFSVGAWVPETFHSVLACAIFDLRFRDEGGMPAFERWVHEGNRGLLRSPLYRVLFLVASPERIFIGAERRWATFHRGSLLRVLDHREGGARVRLTYPAYLFPEHSVVGFGAALLAAVEAAGGKRVRMEWRVESDASTLYTGSWDG
jgi:hypothetical protein